MWVDNFNVVHSRARQPDSPAGHVNGTAVSLVKALDAAPHGWTCQPRPRQMLQSLQPLARELSHVEKTYADELKAISRQPHRFEDVRGPCDRRRRGLVAAPWRPFDITNHNISSTEGLLDVMAYL